MTRRPQPRQKGERSVNPDAPPMTRTESESDFDERVLGPLSWLAERGKIGTRTWKLADRHGCSVAYMRRQLIRLEKAGKLQRNARYSAVNGIFWEINNDPRP